MGLEVLNSRDVAGQFYIGLEGMEVPPWLAAITTEHRTDLEKVTYKGVGMVPRLSEFTGKREADQLRNDGPTIANRIFDATIEISIDNRRRDMTGQVDLRIGELPGAAVDHWAEFVTDALESGEGTTSEFGSAYDGKAFFADDHVWGDESFDNKLAFNAVDPVNPLPTEIRDIVRAAVLKLKGYKDDKGRPLNRGMSEVVVLYPTNMWDAADAAFGNNILLDGGQAVDNTLTRSTTVKWRPFDNPWFTNQDRVYVIRGDARVAAMIRQIEVDPKLLILDENSEYAIQNRQMQFTVEAIRALGYLWPQYATVTLLT